AAELPVAHPLAGGIHRRVVDRVERALGERRERPHLFDLVTKELDAKRLAPRAWEDIDEAAAYGDLPTLLDTLDALVPGCYERVHEAVETGAALPHKPDGVRP